MSGTGTGWWQALRWPVSALVVIGLLLALAFALDTGSSTNRDVALIIGAPVLIIAVPLALLWLVIAAVRQQRRSRPQFSRRSQEPGRTAPDS